jgi:hypothetical protein
MMQFDLFDEIEKEFQKELTWWQAFGVWFALGGEYPKKEPAVRRAKRPSGRKGGIKPRR